MNNVAAGIAGGIAVVLVAGSAMVFASHVGKDDKGTHTECTNERVVTDKDVGTNSVAGTILGGVAGGVIGHQIGGGHGKDVATAAGAVGGAYAGNRIAKKDFPDQEVSYHEKCRDVAG
ncbi:glycine zipper 2TM domain-containing protein [Solimonas terrae]|uniref:Glycine zipper 2TM domain-containing protein n=1 Tax=Solimonas terrae TaxID=1396819 RepID=A0A6M2BMR6_9GAMM|nr:glycine zipper 2TM domain-containing protein [Solimonas terrae]NGY03896.1 glycine zipper 2TM domain-containing protein [Solimonas terrae]